VRPSESISSFLYSKRQNSESKLAHADEQREFTHSGSFVAAGHLELDRLRKPKERGGW